MTSEPRVTIAMPVYNGSNFIADAIRSILAQTYTDFELIVTDNASTDRTREIVEGFAEQDDRVRYIRNEKNIGAAANYNLGFELARGEYFKWQAHDDELSPDYLENCVNALDEDPSVSLVHTVTKGINGDGKVSPLVGAETPSILFDDPVKRFEGLLSYVGDCFSIFGVYRSKYLKISTLHRPYYGSDRGLLAEMAILGKYRRLEEGAFYNREHDTRSTKLGSNMDRARWQNGNNRRIGAAEQINLTKHLFELAKIHADKAPAGRLRLSVLAFASKPGRLGKYAVELFDLTAPGAANRVRAMKRSLSGAKHAQN